MRVIVLGSGSAGNATVVESGSWRVLVDAGFSGKDLERRLATVEIEPESISALIVTHDHGDHTRGMGVFARRWGTALHLTPPTRQTCARLLRGTETVVPYRATEPFRIGPFRVDPFLTVHDAVDPVAVTLTEEESGEKLGIATDLGRPTATVRHALQNCDMLLLESNHDPILLRESPYPWSVKARIGSSHGHLSNRVAAELAVELHHDRLSTIVLAHLSEKANDPDLARGTVEDALGRRFKGIVSVARQEEPLPPVDLSSIRRKNRPQQLSLL